jgi:branched-subunit amino acid transport protein
VRHLAAAVAFAVAWWTKSIAWTLAAGMGSLWVLAWLVPGW